MGTSRFFRIDGAYTTLNGGVVSRPWSTPGHSHFSGFGSRNNGSGFWRANSDFIDFTVTNTDLSGQSSAYSRVLHQILSRRRWEVGGADRYHRLWHRGRAISTVPLPPRSGCSAPPSPGWAFWGVAGAAEKHSRHSHLTLSARLNLRKAAERRFFFFCGSIVRNIHMPTAPRATARPNLTLRCCKNLE